MPLRVDDNYRGPRALHVRDHRKLGKHRTLIRPALGIVNWLIDHDQVSNVAFGKMVGSFESKFTPRVDIKLRQKSMQVLLVARNCAQSIDITVRSETALKGIADKLQIDWPHYQAANDQD